jgi:hypothetical protein
MQNVQIPYGYRSFNVGGVKVFTGKIRVRTELEKVHDTLKRYGRTDHEFTVHKGKSNCIIIQWATTDDWQHRRHVMYVCDLLTVIMCERTVNKYQLQRLRTNQPSKAEVELSKAEVEL